MYLVFSGNTSLIVRDGILAFCDDAVEQKGVKAAPSPDGPPSCRSNIFRFSEVNKFKSGFGIFGRLGPKTFKLHYYTPTYYYSFNDETKF